MGGMNGMGGGGMGAGMAKPMGGPAPPMGAAPSFESPRKMVAANGFSGMNNGMAGGFGGGGGGGGGW